MQKAEIRNANLCEDAGPERIGRIGKNEEAFLNVAMCQGYLSFKGGLACIVGSKFVLTSVERVDRDPGGTLRTNDRAFINELQEFVKSFNKL